LFETVTDYAAFERVVVQALHRVPIRMLAYCAMPNHWHLILWPTTPGQLSTFMHWMTCTHAQRWHASRGTSGTGAVYQGRFKAIPVAVDDHLLRLCRYVERNPLRAGLVSEAEKWRWGSLWRRCNNCDDGILHEWPVALPADWLRQVNTPQSEEELTALRSAVRRSFPYGETKWMAATAEILSLEQHLRPVGRPRRF
jgi:putative transposase